MMTVWTYSVQCTYRTKAGPHIFLHDVCVALNFARAFMRKMARGIDTEIKMMATGDRRRQIHDMYGILADLTPRIIIVN